MLKSQYNKLLEIKYRHILKDNCDLLASRLSLLADTEGLSEHGRQSVKFMIQKLRICRNMIKAMDKGEECTALQRKGGAE
jgi:hypothetical protein